MNWLRPVVGFVVQPAKIETIKAVETSLQIMIEAPAGFPGNIIVVDTWTYHCLMPEPVPESPAWSTSELAANPHANADKPTKVRSMFAAIAGSYDLNNRVHSLGRDQAWRRFAVRHAEPKPTDRVLDVACGTGDLTEAFARSGVQEVVGLDFTAEMLDIARVKAPRHLGAAAARVSYIQGDAQSLPFADQSFDILSIAFGIRNVQDPAQALREFRRVLRPGGRVVVLEFAEPSIPPVRWFNNLYCRRIMPVTATLISGDKSGAYKYLPKSVATFMPERAFMDALRAAGFVTPDVRHLTLGICNCYRAFVRPD